MGWVVESEGGGVWGDGGLEVHPLLVPLSHFMEVRGILCDFPGTR